MAQILSNHSMLENMFDVSVSFVETEILGFVPVFHAGLSTYSVAKYTGIARDAGTQVCVN